MSKFIQVDIAAAEMDNNQPVAAPLVGDVGSVMAALLERNKPGRISVPAKWCEELSARSAQNVVKMADRLTAAQTAHPMRFLGALEAIHEVVGRTPCLPRQQGANALDLARNMIGMQVPRHRLDEWHLGCHGLSMGYAIAAAVRPANR